MDAARLLELWIQHHGDLSAELRGRFLDHAATDELTKQPDACVIPALTKSRRLIEILAEVKRTARWYRGVPCDEDGLDHCARCKPIPIPRWST